MAIPVSSASMIAEAAYKSRYSKADAALIEQLSQRCGGELRKGTLSGEHEGVPFQLTFLPKQQGFVVSVGCRIAGRVRVTRKGRLDRWMEGFVPAIRFRSRDARFDRDFNVHTRDLEFTTALLTRQPNRAVVRRLLERGVREVYVDAERVKATCGRKSLGAKPVAGDVLALVEELAALARCVDAFAASHEVRPVPKTDTTVVFAWIGLGLMAVAGFVMVIAGGVEYTLVRPATFLLPCAIFGLPAIAPVVVLLAFAVQRRTSPYGLVRGLAALSVLAAPLLISGGMLLANGLFDDSPAEEHVVTVLDKSRREKDNKLRYHVGLEAWWPGGDERWLQISRATYDALVPGVSRMRVLTRPGRLGYEWIESYDLAR